MIRFVFFVRLFLLEISLCYSTVRFEARRTNPFLCNVFVFPENRRRNREDQSGEDFSGKTPVCSFVIPGKKTLEKIGSFAQRKYSFAHVYSSSHIHLFFSHVNQFRIFRILGEFRGRYKHIFHISNWKIVRNTSTKFRFIISQYERWFVDVRVPHILKHPMNFNFRSLDGNWLDF